MYSVYIVRCSDGTLYTGIAQNVQERILEHNESELGAKYTRPRRPVILFYQEKVGTRSEAQSREYAIKQLSRKQKEALAK